MELKPRTIGAKHDGYDLVAGAEGETDAEKKRRLQRQKYVKVLDWIWRKLNAAFWVALCCGLIYWTNFFRVIWESDKVGVFSRRVVVLEVGAGMNITRAVRRCCRGQT